MPGYLPLRPIPLHIVPLLSAMGMRKHKKNNVRFSLLKIWEGKKSTVFIIVATSKEVAKIL